MINFAICDDDKEYIDIINRYLNDYLKCKRIDYTVHKFTSGNDLLLSSYEKFDIILLDADMPEIDGIETAKKLRNKNKNCIIVYISAYVDYAMFGYEVQAYRYILKNNLERLFATTMDSILKNFYSQEEKIHISMKYVENDVNLSDIIYVESKKRILEYHIYGNDNKIYSTYGKISDMAPFLESKGFLRIQKSYIVNMRYIQNIVNYTVTLSNGENLKTTIREYNKILDTCTLWKGKF